MAFFFRREEVIDENEKEELDIIDLDQTSEWSRLELERELLNQKQEKYMEELGDELAIIDALENDISIRELEKKAEREKNFYYSESAMEDDDREYGQEEAEEELEEEQEEIKLNYLSMDEEEEEEEEELFPLFEKMGRGMSRFTILDKIVAVMGIIVLAVAVLTISAYTKNRGESKQIVAMAPVGVQMQEVGIIGKDKLLAVADARKALLEAVKVEEELNTQYQEKEETKEIQVAMKMTSVQKDLKIKFVNKKNGKLVSSIPFEVEIVDSKDKKYTKIDEDKDGIIYLKDLDPGNYTVAMVELKDIEGYSFHTGKEKIKVKENIDYEKIDVSDEIKNQNEVDVTKEDTAKKEETEAVLQNTVEWVESRKEAVSSKEAYTQVDKSTIADPALSASLVLDRGILNLMRQGIYGVTIVNPASQEGESGEQAEQSENSTEKEEEKSEEGSSEEGKDSTPPEQGTENPPAATDRIKSILLTSSGEEISEGKTISLQATVEKEGNPSVSIEWSLAGSDLLSLTSSGETATVSLVKIPEQDLTVTITAKAGEVSASKTITVKGKPKVTTIEVTKIELDTNAITLETEKTYDLKVTVSPDNATDKNYQWIVENQSIAKIENGKVTALKQGITKITAVVTANTSIKAECIVTVVPKEETVIKLDKTSATIKIKEALQLTATVTPTGKTVKWNSSKPQVATVDEKGKVTAVAVGDTVITVESDGKKAECKITVTNDYDPKKDTTKLLKDKNGNQIYVKVDGKYVEAKVADYYIHSTFYKKENVSDYRYFGWQNLDGKTYYFDKNGNKITGEQVIQGAKYTFNSDGSLNNGSGVLGIDVSTWNGNINWSQVKNSGVSYVIIRTGFRGSTQGALVEDNKFRQNIKGALDAGLKVGVYFFTQAVNEVEAVEEASMVLSQIKGYKITYPVFIDVESSGGRADGLDAGTRTRVINAFCQTIQNGGYRAGIYANKTWLAQKMNISALSGYKIWLAQYNTHVTYGGRYDMWQYSSSGSVAGISGKVDMNLSYMSY